MGWSASAIGEAEAKQRQSRKQKNGSPDSLQHASSEGAATEMAGGKVANGWIWHIVKRNPSKQDKTLYLEMTYLERSAVLCFKLFITTLQILALEQKIIIVWHCQCVARMAKC